MAASLRGSRKLTAGNYTHIFIYVVLLAVIFAIPNTIVTFGFGNTDNSAASVSVGMLVHLFTASFGALSAAVFYYDLVVRKEISDEAIRPEE